jgi:hypothetical protein
MLVNEKRNTPSLCEGLRFLRMTAVLQRLKVPCYESQTTCDIKINGGGQECPPCTELCLHSQLPTTNMSPLFSV